MRYYQLQNKTTKVVYTLTKSEYDRFFDNRNPEDFEEIKL